MQGNGVVGEQEVVNFRFLNAFEHKTELSMSW